ncbi:DUF4188 domain-containing protein [Nocardioides sp. KR10-350]|uniref:DUF4188 domain-containing protein n=1 Tax=Nocardioides cheoyonin TaxID=3156615 RepID=UPI0032B345F0
MSVTHIPRPRRVPRGYERAPARAPKRVLGGQYVADLPDQEVVVFLVGMRINRLRRVGSWWPVFRAMRPMIIEAMRTNAGLLHAQPLVGGRTIVVVQYWRSAEELGRYARNSGMLHAPAWAEFNRAAAGTGDVGIFHETYVVPRESIESVYGNMPAFGLARALGLHERGAGEPVVDANRRMGTTTPEYADAP